LRQLEIPELVTQSYVEFVQKAVALAHHPGELQALRSKNIARSAE
jgi:predicted O-linked N-acetylglucosamine transferase (SPINDLY family)